MKSILISVIIIVDLVVQIATIAYGQSQVNCTCDLTITKSGSYSGKDTSIQPGQTVCIQAGTYTNIYFNNFIGTDKNPIRFVNCGGQVVISSDKLPAGLQFYGCKNFIVSGAGSSEHTYGLLIAKSAPGTQALRIENKSTDCEIEHVEIAGAGFAGIMVKTDPTCDSTTWRDRFVMRNVNIHHNYIHDTDAEGMYVGSAFWNEGHQTKCNGVEKRAFPHNIYGLKIHHNITERTGAEGIQYAAAFDAEVHHNIVRSSGRSPFATFQNNGIQIGGGVSGRFYNNQIFDTPGVGIILIGNLGNTRVFNNLVVNSGINGIFCDDRPGSIANTPMEFLNNTIVNSGEESIKLYNEINKNIISNNIMSTVGKGRNFVSFSQGATAQQNANYMAAFADSVGFVDSNKGDFRLANTSALIDKGSGQFLEQLSFDLDGNKRFIGLNVDIGAYEYHPETDQIFTLYPSPCDDQLYVWSNQLVDQISVFNLSGVTLMQLNSSPADSFSLSLQSLPTGIYVLRAKTAVGYVSKRFLKR